MSTTHFDSVNKIWSGSKLPSIYNTDVSLGYLVLNVLQNVPDAITQISVTSGVEVTCRQMYQKSIKIARYLQELNYEQGDIVGFVASNCDELAPTVFACLTLGLPICSLFPTMSEDEMIAGYSKTKPKLIFCDAGLLTKIEIVAKALSIECAIVTLDDKVDQYAFIGDVTNRECDDFENFVIPFLDSNSIAFIMATSGTSGKIKFVCRSHKQIIKEMNEPWKSRLSSQEIWMSPMTIYWMTGVHTLLFGTLCGGRRVMANRPLEPKDALKTISKYNITTMITTPHVLAKLINCESGKNGQFDSLKVLLASGRPLSKRLYERLKLLFPNCDICPAYACTESGILALNLSNVKCESVGQIHGNVEIKIIDGSGNSLGPDEAGEIVAKVETNFFGYFDDPTETAEVLRNGWTYTGDVGYVDEDGFLFVVDRNRNLFRCDCVLTNVSATELEFIIDEIPDIEASSVTGVYQDQIGSDLIFAFVVKKPNSTLSEQYIEDYVAERVVPGKKIKGGVHFVDCLPYTISGKIRLAEVKSWAVIKLGEMKT